MHAIPSGAIFGIAFGIAFGFSLEVMSYRKHNNLYNHYEKNIHYFKNNLTTEMHNRFAQLYLETKNDMEFILKQLHQLQKEHDEVIQILHEYLEINVSSKSRTNSRSYSFDSHVSIPLNNEKND
jgi:hypothetical protein